MGADEPSQSHGWPAAFTSAHARPPAFHDRGSAGGVPSTARLGTGPWAMESPLLRRGFTASGADRHSVGRGSLVASVEGARGQGASFDSSASLGDCSRARVVSLRLLAGSWLSCATADANAGAADAGRPAVKGRAESLAASGGRLEGEGDQCEGEECEEGTHGRDPITDQHDACGSFEPLPSAGTRAPSL